MVSSLFYFSTGSIFLRSRSKLIDYLLGPSVMGVFFP